MHEIVKSLSGFQCSNSRSRDVAMNWPTMDRLQHESSVESYISTGSFWATVPVVTDSGSTDTAGR